MATDRHIKVIRIIAIDSNIQYPKHDFTSGYKAIPCGILVADPTDYSTYLDIHNKERISKPSKWTLFVNIRFNKLAGTQLPMSYSEHGEDLQFVADKHFTSAGKDVPADWKIDSDMGSDSDYFTDKAIIVLADVFKSNQLGTLILGGPCGQNSSQNEIEAAWSPLKMSIAGLILSDTVGSDTMAPDKQTDLTHEQMVIKDLAVFKNVGGTLQKAWSTLNIRGNPVQVRYTLPEVPFTLSIVCFISKV